MALHRSYPINVCKYTGMKECSHQSACIDRTLQTPPIWKIESWYRIFSSQSYVVDLFYWSILNQRPVRALSWDNEARARVAVLESIIITYRLRELNLSCWTLTYVGVSISCTTYTSANWQISLNTLCLSSLWKSSYTSRQPHQRHFWKRFSWGTFLKMKTYVQRTPVLPVWGPVIQAPLSIFWHPQSPGIIRTRRADYKRNFEGETFFLPRPLWPVKYSCTVRFLKRRTHERFPSCMPDHCIKAFAQSFLSNICLSCLSSSNIVGVVEGGLKEVVENLPQTSWRQIFMGANLNSTQENLAF